MEKVVATDAKGFIKSGIPLKHISTKHFGLILVLSSMLFSIVVFRTEENLKIYFFVSLLSVGYAVFKSMLKPSLVGKAMNNSFFLWLILIFAMYFIYGLVLPSYDYFSIKYFMLMFILSLVVLLIFAGIPYITMLELFIKTSAYICTAITLYVLTTEWSNINLGGIRIGNMVSGNVNTLAINLGILTVPLLYKIVLSKKYIYLAPYVISIVVMILTGSKKAIMIILVSIFVLAIIENRLRMSRYLPYVIIVTIILFLIFNVGYLYSIIGSRIVDFLGTIGFKIGGARSSNSTMLRILMYKEGFKAFLEKPLFGGGWFYFSEYSGLGTYSHNNYIEMLTSYGIFGFTLYYGMIMTILFKLKKMIHFDNGAKLLFSLVVIILANDFASVSFSSNIIYYIVLIVGYLYLKGYREECWKNRMQLNR